MGYVIKGDTVVTPMRTSCRAVFHWRSVRAQATQGGNRLALLICVGLTSADGIDGLKYRLTVRCSVRTAHHELEGRHTGGGRDL